MKTINDAIRDKFRKLGFETATEFVKKKNSALSMETYAAVLFRDTKPSLKTMLIMMVELGFTAREVSDYLVAQGDIAIAKLIDPSDLTVDEKDLIEAYRKLGDHAKERLVRDMIDKLA